MAANFYSNINDQFFVTTTGTVGIGAYTTASTLGSDLNIKNNAAQIGLESTGTSGEEYVLSSLSTGSFALTRVGLGDVMIINNAGAYSFDSSFGTAGYILSSQGNADTPTWIANTTGTVTGTGAANRVTYWSSATNVTSDAGFTYNGAGRVNTDESFGVSKDGADTTADGPFFRLTNAAATRQYLWQLDASNNIDYWYYSGSAWTQTISLLNNGGANFSGNLKLIAGASTTYFSEKGLVELLKN